MFFPSSSRDPHPDLEAHTFLANLEVIIDGNEYSDDAVPLSHRLDVIALSGSSGFYTVVRTLVALEVYRYSRNAALQCAIPIADFVGSEQLECEEAILGSGVKEECQA